ncbi:unnamed protein product [Pleuronectes platessa]|uniref:Uncharacterized protein n=1 Tax=Pleuronectes platessa TaxID=8262 RepID=A0A9N7VHP0_PLEPL|nr:unnamed protein product [Pleuronectes platessa]
MPVVFGLGLSFLSGPVGFEQKPAGRAPLFFYDSSKKAYLVGTCRDLDITAPYHGVKDFGVHLTSRFFIALPQPNCTLQGVSSYVFISDRQRRKKEEKTQNG